MASMPLYSCIHCAESIYSTQSYRVHRRWFSRIHNACFWALIESRLVRMNVNIDDPARFADEGRSACALFNTWSLPRLDDAAGAERAAS